MIKLTLNGTETEREVKENNFYFLISEKSWNLYIFFWYFVDFCFLMIFCSFFYNQTSCYSGDVPCMANENPANSHSKFISLLPHTLTISLLMYDLLLLLMNTTINSLFFSFEYSFEFLWCGYFAKEQDKVRFDQMVLDLMIHEYPFGFLMWVFCQEVEKCDLSTSFSCYLSGKFKVSRRRRRKYWFRICCCSAE